MIDKTRKIAVISVFFAFIFTFALFIMFSPDKEYLTSERRTAAQKPELNVASLKTDYFDLYEKYLLDKFSFRDKFRFINNTLLYYCLNLSDINGYSLCRNGQTKLLYPMNETNVSHTAGFIDKVCRNYFPDSENIYFSLIYDKNYYTDSILKLDCDEMAQMLINKAATPVAYVDISKALSLEDYYATDIHWKQTEIYAVADILAESMGFEIEEKSAFKTNLAGVFYGGLHGHSALPSQPDEMYYLTSTLTENAIVSYADNPSGSIYADLAFDTLDDKYDLFMRGETLNESAGNAFITIENPLFDTPRELIIFRDSFARSLVPLILNGYSKITLIDVRTNSSLYKNNSRYFDYSENTDILFLLSAQVVNTTLLQ